MSAAEQYPMTWLSIDWKVKGIILGMEKMGAVFDGIKYPYILFTIPKESYLHNNSEALKRGYDGCIGLTGLRMKVKHV